MKKLNWNREIDGERIFGNQIIFAIETIKEIYKDYKDRKELKKMKKLYNNVKEEDITLANEGIEDWVRMLNEIDKEK